jgi:hypothetical protein
MSYSWRQIIRLHGRALQEFEKIYGETYKNWTCHRMSYINFVIVKMEKRK